VPTDVLASKCKQAKKSEPSFFQGPYMGLQHACQDWETRNLHTPETSLTSQWSPEKPKLYGEFLFQKANRGVERQLTSRPGSPQIHSETASSRWGPFVDVAQRDP
ncbi:mCG146009, partial [Mus musculus]